MVFGDLGTLIYDKVKGGIRRGDQTARKSVLPRLAAPSRVTAEELGRPLGEGVD